MAGITRGGGGGGGGDARYWDEDRYRRSILNERELQYRIVFRTLFAPSSDTNPENLVVALSDGSIATYSISSCVSSAARTINSNKRITEQSVPDYVMVEPLFIFQGHKGPTYDLKFYGDGEDSLLLSCGDDGRIRGWRWLDILNSEMPMAKQGNRLNPILDIVNPQHEGLWNSLSPIPENNAIAVNKEEGSIFSASGDASAYCWDVETGKTKMVFQGHTDYLHCVVARKSSNQIITGSEDGTTRIWDCRSGLSTQVIYPGKTRTLKKCSWISSVAIDRSENWLVCGTGWGLSVWSLLSCDCISSIDSRAPVQDLLFGDDQILAVGSEPVLTRSSMNGRILSQIQCAPQSAFSVALHPSGVTAVGGYGGLVDVMSEFGSHLCIFRSQGLNANK